jgi:hypothetical protein
MQTHQQVVEALARITDDALLGTPRDDLVERAYTALDRVSFDGIALRAPQRIDLRKSASAPVLLVAAQDAQRAGRVPLPANAFFLITHVGPGGQAVSPAFPEPAHKIPLPDQETPPPPSSPSPTARTTGVEFRDLHAAKALPWEAGRYAVRVLAWDWTSNVVTITLAGDASTKPASIVAASGPAEPGGLPSFLKVPESPALGAPGVALALPSTPVKAGTPVVARGGLRLAADSEWPKTADGTTVVPATVVLTRLGILTPILIDVRIPLPAGTDLSPGREVEAYFSVDLAKSRTSPLPAVEYSVWLVSGEHLAGPVPLHLVS